jgi:hypothetical protein
VVDAGQALLREAGFDAAPAWAAIEQALASQGLPAPAAGWDGLALAVQEDVAVLDGTEGRLALLNVCVPSHWAPQSKLGLSFAAVHAPVADNRLLLAAAGPLMHKVTDGGHWERFVWTLSPSARHDQHPQRHAPTPWPPAEPLQALAEQCWLRSEHQTFLPVTGAQRQAVFTIRVSLQALTQAVRSSADARRLHDALRSMSDAVLGYKNLACAREPLCRWLLTRAQQLP